MHRGRRSMLAGAAALAVGCVLPTRLVSAANTRTPTPRLRAQRLAWAGVRLQLDAGNLYLDPLLDPKVWGPALPDALVPIDPPGEGNRYVLVTHRHPDHFDPVAIRQALGETGTLVCTADTASAAAAAGFRVRLAALYEPLLLGDFTVTAVPASDGYGDPQVSWVVSGGGRRILHGGDTLWHGAWWQIGRQHGPFDAAFLPINGARFGWRKPVSDVPAVLTPQQAVAAAVVLNARLLVPIHYGMQPSPEYSEIAQPESDLREAARARDVAVQILHPGDWLDWTAAGRN